MGHLQLGCAVSRLPLPTPRAFPRGYVAHTHVCSNYQIHCQIDERNSQNCQVFRLKRTPKFFDGRSTSYKRYNEKSSTSATSSHSADSESEANGVRGPWNSIQTSFDIFYRFTRPHTVIGTALSIISVSLLAIETVSDISPLFFIGLLEALVSAIFMNVYIVGLNQLFDIEIDKVNKPYLPLASGEYSIRSAVMIVTVFALMSFIIGWAVGSWPLLWALFISFLLGSAYSTNLPMLRWKRSAVVAAMCILAVRAVIVQIAFYMHIQNFVFGRSPVLTRPLIFATAFMSFFSVVIALFKDIPDIDGDRIFGIRSFSVRLGQKRVFWICISLLQMAYIVAAIFGVTSSCTWSKVVTVLGHTFLALFLWNHAKSFDLSDQAAIKSFYMFVWKIMICGFSSFASTSHSLYLSTALLCRILAHTPGEMNNCRKYIQF